MIVGFLARLGAVIDAAGSLHDKLTGRRCGGVSAVKAGKSP